MSDLVEQVLSKFSSELKKFSQLKVRSQVEKQIAINVASSFQEFYTNKKMQFKYSRRVCMNARNVRRNAHPRRSLDSSTNGSEQGNPDIYSDVPISLGLQEPPTDMEEVRGLR